MHSSALSCCALSRKTLYNGRQLIRSFASRDAEELFNGGSPRKFRSFREQAERKLRIIDSAKQSVSRSHAKVAQ